MLGRFGAVRVVDVLVERVECGEGEGETQGQGSLRVSICRFRQVREQTG